MGENKALLTLLAYVLTFVNGIGIIVCIILYFTITAYFPWWIGTLLILSPVWMPVVTYGLLCCCVCSGALCCGCDLEDEAEAPDMTYTCPLCRELVTDRTREHRLVCLDSSGYREEYDRLAVMYPELQCPSCKRDNRLKLWPENKQERFECQEKKDSCEGQDNSEIRNRGSNLFKCFPCDYNICFNCAQSLRRSQVDRGALPESDSPDASKPLITAPPSAPSAPPPSYNEAIALEQMA